MRQLLGLFYFMIEDQGNYYLYRWIRLDKSKVFYIGIGTKNYKSLTYKSHYREALRVNDRGNFFKSIHSKTETEVQIIIESNDYEFIKQKEIEFIALYGRRDLGKGTLVNLTDGGNGFTNLVFTDLHRQKLSNSLKGKRHSNETKEKLRRARKNQILSKESYQKIADKLCKSVDMFDSNGKFIKRFNSIKEASLYTNTSHSAISAVLNKRRNSVNERIFKFAISEDLPADLENINIMTWEKARKIRLLKQQGATRGELVEIFNFNLHQIKSIIYNKSWVE